MKFTDALNIADVNALVWQQASPSRKMQSGVSCVYMALSRGSVIYVGTTKCLKSRLNSNHYLRPQKNVYYTIIEDGKFKLESKLIKLLNPKFNQKTGTPVKPKDKKLKQVSVYVLPKYVKLVKAKCLAIAARYR